MHFLLHIVPYLLQSNAFPEKFIALSYFSVSRNCAGGEDGDTLEADARKPDCKFCLYY